MPSTDQTDAPVKSLTVSVFLMRAGETSPTFFSVCECGWAGTQRRYPLTADPEGELDRSTLKRSQFILRGADEVEAYSTDAARAARRLASEDARCHILDHESKRP